MIGAIYIGNVLFHNRRAVFWLASHFLCRGWCPLASRDPYKSNKTQNKFGSYNFNSHSPIRKCCNETLRVSLQTLVFREISVPITTQWLVTIFTIRKTNSISFKSNGLAYLKTWKTTLLYLLNSKFVIILDRHSFFQKCGRVVRWHRAVKRKTCFLVWTVAKINFGFFKKSSRGVMNRMKGPVVQNTNAFVLNNTLIYFFFSSADVFLMNDCIWSFSRWTWMTFSTPCRRVSQPDAN